MMAYDYSQYGGVLVGRQGKVLTITLNSPETLNAFTGPMHTSMSRIWDDVNDDPDVHVVVLTGAGRAFSAGGNVIAMQTKIDDPNAWDAGMPEARRIVFRMLECDKPIIAFIAHRFFKRGAGETWVGAQPGELLRKAGKAIDRRADAADRRIDPGAQQRAGDDRRFLRGQFPGVGGGMNRRAEAPGSERLALHLHLEPSKHRLRIGNGGCEEFVLRPERVENHVAVGQQAATALAG
jgi:hypothetical protein